MQKSRPREFPSSCEVPGTHSPRYNDENFRNELKGKLSGSSKATGVPLYMNLLPHEERSEPNRSDREKAIPTAPPYNPSYVYASSPVPRTEYARNATNPGELRGENRLQRAFSFAFSPLSRLDSWEKCFLVMWLIEIYSDFIMAIREPSIPDWAGRDAKTYELINVITAVSCSIHATLAVLQKQPQEIIALVTAVAIRRLAQNFGEESPRSLIIGLCYLAVSGRLVYKYCSRRTLLSFVAKKLTSETHFLTRLVYVYLTALRVDFQLQCSCLVLAMQLHSRLAKTIQVIAGLTITVFGSVFGHLTVTREKTHLLSFCFYYCCLSLSTAAVLFDNYAGSNDTDLYTWSTLYGLASICMRFFLLVVALSVYFLRRSKSFKDEMKRRHPSENERDRRTESESPPNLNEVRSTTSRSHFSQG